MQESYRPGVGIAAGSWMLKWDLLNRELEIPMQPYGGPIEIQDSVNIYFNFECILKSLTLQRGLATAITYYKQNVVLELESAILNLVAHYRGYFIKRYRKVCFYFYYTDLRSDIPQAMTSYDKFYRTYYQNHYTANPQFHAMSDLLLDTIIPEIRLILSYIPGCYFIKASGFDSSLVPHILANHLRADRNVILSGDLFDTQYLFQGGMDVIYIKRRFQHFGVMHTIPDIVASIIKEESRFDLTLFNSELYYRLLLTTKGSKIRNIKGSKGFGYTKFIQLLQDGMKRDIVLRDFSSIYSIAELFPEKYREDMIHAFQCLNLDTQISMLGENHVQSVLSQRIDKMDMESIQSLNNRRFLEYPIKLIYLLEKNPYS